MKQTTQLDAAFKVAAFAPLAAGMGIGAAGGYGLAGDTPEEKMEGMGRGAIRGGATMSGAGIGAALGARLGMEGQGGSTDMMKLLAALGLLGGGAAGYAASGAMMGKSTSDKKKEKKEQAAPKDSLEGEY